MESKGADGPRSSSVSKAGEGSWWRWTHGKSGSISSSSSGRVNGALHDGFPSSNHSSTSSRSSKAATSASASSPSHGMRWHKRAARCGLLPKDDSNGAAASSFGAMWGSSTTSPPASSGSTTSSPKFLASSSATRGSSRSTSSKKKASSSSSTFVFSAFTREEKPLASDISWSLGCTKRQKARKDKKSGKGASSGLSSGRSGSRAASAARSSACFLLDVSEDTEMRAADAGASGAFAFPAAAQSKPSRSSSSATSYGFASSHYRSSKEPSGQETPLFDFDDGLSRYSQPAFPPASPSTVSTTSSFSSQSFSTVDPLVSCARAVLQDCIRSKRKIEQSSARKRTIEGCFGAELLEGKDSPWQFGSVSKSSEYGLLSSGASSSSDDELSQLSSLDHSFNCGEKTGRESESKLAREEVYRQILVGDYDLSSSPEYQCISPLFEEKGLPIEIRYQLPLALGTANETNKECTICQIRYGIGDHIVTLPCQHFFHACCVDKWLWNHMSCPLCRTEVTLDLDTDIPSTKHKFTECSQVDQERIRRQMRSSSQCAGFRPVVPVNLDQLETQVSRMTIDEEDAQAEQPDYLVCPTPHLATGLQGNSTGN